MIIAGGEPDLCCSMAWRGAKREGGVYARTYALRVQNAVCLCRKVCKRVCVK